MATMQILADQVKRCMHNYRYNYGSYTWSDVTNNEDTTLYKLDYSDSGLYDNDTFLQFRIPAIALTGFNINSVKVFMHCLSLNRTIPLWVFVNNTADMESQGGESSISNSIAASGWSDTDITVLFNALDNQDAIWYVQARIASVSRDINYEAYINTLNGDYDPYIEIEYTPEPCAAPALGALSAIC